MNFSGAPFLSLLVGVLFVHESAFYCQLCSFCQVFFSDLGEFAPRYDMVPLGVGHFFALGILIGFIGGKIKGGQFFSFGKWLDLGRLTEVSDELYFVAHCVHF